MMNLSARPAPPTPADLRLRFPNLRNARRLIANATRRGIRRDADVKPSDWAERHRVIAEGTSAHPGKWRNSRTPYLVEIMDCLAPTHPARRVTFAKSAQIAGSEMISNVLLWIADIAPGPTLVVHPTIEAGQDWVNEKFDPTIESTPRAARKIAAYVERGRGGSTLKRKRFPGGSIVVTGANTARGLRQKSIKTLLCDDYDDFPLTVGGQGDPVGMARARLISFKKTAQDKELDVSTPTVRKISRIWQQFEDGTRARYHVHCPHCDHPQVLKWGGPLEKFGIKFEIEVPHRAHYVCEAGGCIIDRWQLESMLAPENGARWVHERPEPGREPSYHINALYSPFVTWDDAVKAFLDAKDDPEKLKTFVNLWLGEPWDEQGDLPKAAVLMKRRTMWEFGTLPGLVGPGGPLMISMGVDVQGNGLYYEALATGRDRQTWSLEHGFIDGDTATEQSVAWVELDKIRKKRFRDALGTDRPVDALLVDANYQTDIVVNWCKSRLDCFPIHGVDGLNVVPWLGRAIARERSERGKARRKGAKSYPVGTWQLKSRFYGQLKQVQREGSSDFPAGFCHFNQDWFEEDFEQLLSEMFVRRRDRKTGKERVGWHQVGTANHLLDCRIYALAGFEKLGISRKSPAEWEWLERRWLRAGDQRELFSTPDLGDADPETNGVRPSVPDLQQFRPEPGPEPFEEGYTTLG